MSRDGKPSSGSRGIRSFQVLEVYRIAFDLAMRIFEESKRFPAVERLSLIDQCRRSSRSVAANVAEAWRKRRYEAAFVAKLSDAETEATETQAWIELAVRCGYLERDEARRLYAEYDALIAKLVGMFHHAKEWTIRKK